MRIAIVTGLTLVLFMIVEGCGQDTSLANGVAACRTDAECPSDYHCATDLTCWHNGRDPVGDASLAEAGGPDCRAKVLCGSACIDTVLDRDNCGACGKKCASAEVCSTSLCALSCAGGTTLCGTTCRDTGSDPANCGTCGNVCGDGLVCTAGACAVDCAADHVNCNGSCIDPLTNRTSCGATLGCGIGTGSAGKTCAAGNVCGNGACQVSCPGAQVDCNGLCIDPQTSLARCGATLGCGLGDAGGSGGVPCTNGNVCGNGTCQVSCPGTQVNCGGVCVDPLTSRSNCGATGACGNGGGSAGAACAPGNVCGGGTCGVVCPGGQIDCGGTCIDPQTSRGNCGASGACGNGGGTTGVSCSNGNVCAAGSCQVSCPGTQIDCGGTCIDPATNRGNCGATGACGNGGGTSGNICSAGNVCSAGTCQVSCPGGQINCGGTCVDPLTSRGNCGASGACGNGGGSAGAACASGLVCAAGSCNVSCPGSEINCAGSCVDPLTSRGNCGATGACGSGGGSTGALCSSGSVCANGTCQVSCPGSQIDCNGTCVAPQTNRANCGATSGCGKDGIGSAGAACSTGNVCGNGTCQVSCPGSQITCAGTCIDPLTSRGNCGASGACGNGGGGAAGAACGAGSVCAGGSCQVSCPGSQLDCGGTCIDPSTNRSYCGASGACGNGGGNMGTSCPDGQVCTGGACQVSCPGTQLVCGGSCVDPRTSVSNCGATSGCGNGGGSAGAVCGAGTACSAGTCSASCQAPLIACGTCVDPRNDPGHCNGCNPCPAVANVSASFCAASACGIATCRAGFANCNGVVADGCEVDTRSSVNNCGKCGMRCAGGLTCNAGVCQ